MRYLMLLMLASLRLVAAEPVNVLPHGTCEQLADGRPTGWALQPGAALAVEDGNHYLEFTSTKPNFSAWAGTSLKLDPAWSALQISVRLRVKDLKLGPEGWHNARCVLNFRTADGKDAGYPEPPKLTADSPWVTQTVTINVPPNATVLQLQPGLWGSQGVMGLDDLIVTPVERPLPFAGPALRLDPARGLVEGTFEQAATGGVPEGWAWDARAQMVAKAGHHWVRLTNDNPLALPAIRCCVRLSGPPKRLQVSARLQATRLKCGAEAWQNARLVLSPLDANGQPLPSLPGPALAKSTPWTTVSSTVELDPATRYLLLWAGLWQATGVLEIDDVQVKPVD